VGAERFPSFFDRDTPQRRTAPQARIQRNSVTSTMLGKPAEESPEPWLERIAQLRQQGKHDEADKALAEFRKRYPEFKIPPAMLERVERR
jgi:hypothetical protein